MFADQVDRCDDRWARPVSCFWVSWQWIPSWFPEKSKDVYVPTNEKSKWSFCELFWVVTWNFVSLFVNVIKFVFTVNFHQQGVSCKEKCGPYVSVTLVRQTDKHNEERKTISLTTKSSEFLFSDVIPRKFLWCISWIVMFAFKLPLFIFWLFKFCRQSRNLSF